MKTGLTITIIATPVPQDTASTSTTGVSGTMTGGGDDGAGGDVGGWGIGKRLVAERAGRKPPMWCLEAQEWALKHGTTVDWAAVDCFPEDWEASDDKESAPPGTGCWKDGKAVGCMT